MKTGDLLQKMLNILNLFQFDLLEEKFNATNTFDILWLNSFYLYFSCLLSTLKSLNTHQVYNHIFMESVSPLSSNLTHIHHSLRVVCINMKDRGVDDPCNICRIRRGTCHPGICGETDLWGGWGIWWEDRQTRKRKPSSSTSKLLIMKNINNDQLFTSPLWKSYKDWCKHDLPLTTQRAYSTPTTRYYFKDNYHLNRLNTLKLRTWLFTTTCIVPCVV